MEKQDEKRRKGNEGLGREIRKQKGECREGNDKIKKDWQRQEI